MLKPHALLASAILFAPAILIVACDSNADTQHPASEYGLRSGGDATVLADGGQACMLPIPDLPAGMRATYDAGHTLFNTPFVPAGGSPRPGLGPLFDQYSCDECHFRGGRSFAGLALIRLSVPGQDEHGAPLAAPAFGTQLQPRGTAGVMVEGTPEIQWVEVPGLYDDGTPFSLRRPVVTIGSPYAPLPAELRMSLRAAPPVFGLGLLEAIDDSAIRALADPTDANADGISGRVQNVWDHLAGQTTLGRFGWKAEVPSLWQQVATAYHQNMGITSSLFADEPCVGQPQDHAQADDPEVSDADIDAVVEFLRTVAVPARRHPDNPVTLRGEHLFRDIGCDGCHTPTLITGNSHPLHILRRQTIHPFTDLLLHDMGPDLSDGRPAFDAAGAEWRTPPLWGLGLRDVVSTSSRLLHDGRARTVAEAILWHGGEAEASRERFRTLTADDRDALLQFLDAN